MGNGKLRPVSLVRDQRHAHSQTGAAGYASPRYRDRESRRCVGGRPLTLLLSGQYTSGSG